MDRRKFIRRSAQVAAAGTVLINGLPVRLLGNQRFLHESLPKGVGDRILVLIQLHGGNDGLNTLVPVQQYGQYQSMRTNIAIPQSGQRKYIDLDTTLAAADQAGLHPDMTSLKSLYDDSKVSIIRGVGYNNTNGSHFRSRDIWFMGGDYNDYKTSGWMGRYLDYIFPNYPANYPTPAMPDPLGLEIGNKVSLGYYRSQGIPTAIATPDPGNFNNLISGLGGPPPDSLPGNHYGLEAQNILDMFGNASDYAAQLQNRYTSGNNYVTYPKGTVQQYTGPAPSYLLQNPLGEAMETIARLIHGGCKTKIYLVSLNGFDTHNSQAETGDPTHGHHASLLFHLSNAVKAFFDDLALSGMDEEVIAMTFTDFGRRPASNASDGTDHGTASPTFVFGKTVNPGVIGTNPSLTNLDQNGNLLIQHDYRQVLTSILDDWLGADIATLSAVEFDTFVNQKLPIIHPGYIAGITDQLAQESFTILPYPNPASNLLMVKTNYPEGKEVQIQIFDAVGSLVQSISSSSPSSEQISIVHLPSGNYIIRMVNGSSSASAAFVKK